MTPIKRRLLYIFRGSLLRLRISWNHGTSLTLSVGYHVDRSDGRGKPKWDGARCVRNTSHGPDKTPAQTINKVLDNLEDSIDRAFYSFEATDAIPSPRELRAAIRGDAPSGSPDLLPAYDAFLADGVKNRFWSEGTARKMKGFRKLLLEFRPGLSLRDLDRRKLSEFVAFMASKTYRDREKPLANTTAARYVNYLKWFLKWALENDLSPNTDFQTFRPALRQPERPVVFLTWEELMRVYTHDFSASPILDQARDVFCFCCFTSLRWSDAAALRRSNVGESRITITTRKTTDTLEIELNKYSRAILRKYEKARFPGGKALPVPSNARLNARITEVGKVCGIDEEIPIVRMYGARREERAYPKWQLMTSHCARRTFICNALALGISPTTVMAWTGHSDFKSMRPYIAVAASARSASMALFDARQKEDDARQKEDDA